MSDYSYRAAATTTTAPDAPFRYSSPDELQQLQREHLQEEENQRQQTPQSLQQLHDDEYSGRVSSSYSSIFLEPQTEPEPKKEEDPQVAALRSLMMNNHDNDNEEGNGSSSSSSFGVIKPVRYGRVIKRELDKSSTWPPAPMIRRFIVTHGRRVAAFFVIWAFMVVVVLDYKHRSGSSTTSATKDEPNHQHHHHHHLENQDENLLLLHPPTLMR